MTRPLDFRARRRDLVNSSSRAVSAEILFVNAASGEMEYK